MRRLVGVAGTIALAAGLAACGTGHSVPVRPVWDGYGTYAAGVMPLCPARDAGNAALPADGTPVECTIDGRQYAWTVMAGCVIPGTHVTVPSLEGARFGGKPHSCVNGAWVPFNVRFNQS